MWRVLRTLKNPRRVREIGLCRKATPEWKQLLGAYLGFVFQPFSIELSSGRFEFLEKSDVATFWQIFFAQVYPLRPSDRIIVDAGGNIGAFSLFALLAIPECRVFTVEPSPGSFERLRSVLKAHGVDRRCTAINAALGGSIGSTTIMSAGPSQFRRTGAAGDAVPMVTLESILPPGDTDLLKMDIEGAEYDALGSATPAVLQRIRRIVLEMHPTEGTPYRWPSLREHLVSAGFHVTMETDDGGGYGIAHLER
ncbi:MAG TPA: FkbM family methyltransferase [Bryobacteraceae bacterium]|nr:FkbM family methyltransferase [Bryobacteraceae bacterium]